MGPQYLQLFKPLQYEGLAGGFDSSSVQETSCRSLA